MNPQQSWPTEWPKVARDIAAATADALAAVRAANRDALTEAVDELRTLSFEQVTSVHAAIVRELLEEILDWIARTAQSNMHPTSTCRLSPPCTPARSGLPISKTIRSGSATVHTCVQLCL